jgi:hypothetical protein
MFPPWAMNTPKTHPSASSQPMMTNMGVLGSEPLPGLIGPAAMVLSVLAAQLAQSS